MASVLRLISAKPMEGSMKDFSYPLTNNTRCLCAASKTRKSGDGFEACAALYFGGKRIAQHYAIAPTRSQAIRLVMELIKHGPKR